MSKQRGLSSNGEQTPQSRPRRETTPVEMAEVRAFRERSARRSEPPKFKMHGDALAFDGEVPEQVLIARLASAVGTTDRHIMGLLTNQVAGTTKGITAADQLNAAVAVLAAIQPRNETEGLIAVQIVGCHNLAMAMLDRATRTERVDFLAVYGNLATKLLRTFAAQTDALARMRGQTGQQTVRVEHVTVEAGGQAVVGSVATGGARG